MFLFRRGPGVAAAKSSGEDAANAGENDVNVSTSAATDKSNEGNEAESPEGSVHKEEVEEVDIDRESEDGEVDSSEDDESEYETDDDDDDEEETPRKRKGWFSFLRRGKDEEENDADGDEDESSNEEESEDDSDDEGKDHGEPVTSDSRATTSQVNDTVQPDHVPAETTNGIIQSNGLNVATNKRNSNNTEEPETPHNKHREIITSTLESPPPPPLTIEQQQDEAILMAQAIQRVQQRIQSKGGNLYEALSEEDKELVDALRGVDDEEKIREVVGRSMEKEWGIGKVMNEGGTLSENIQGSEKVRNESENEVESVRNDTTEAVNREAALQLSATKKPAISTETSSMQSSGNMPKMELEVDQTQASVASSESTIQAGNTDDNDAVDKSAEETNQNDFFDKNYEGDVVTEPSFKTEQSVQDESVQTEKSMANSTIPSMSLSPTPINTSTESSLETVNSVRNPNGVEGAMLAKDGEMIAEKEADGNVDRDVAVTEQNGATGHHDDEDEEDNEEDDDEDEPTIEEKRSLLSLAAEHDRVDVINELLSMCPSSLHESLLAGISHDGSRVDTNNATDGNSDAEVVEFVPPPLHAAVAHGSVNAASCLLRMGADPSIRPVVPPAYLYRSRQYSSPRRSKSGSMEGDRNYKKYHGMSAWELAFGSWVRIDDGDDTTDNQEEESTAVEKKVVEKRGWFGFGSSKKESEEISKLDEKDATIDSPVSNTPRYRRRQPLNIPPTKLDGIRHAFTAEALRAIGSDEVDRLQQLLDAGLDSTMEIAGKTLVGWAAEMDAKKCCRLLRDDAGHDDHDEGADEEEEFGDESVGREEIADTDQISEIIERQQDKTLEKSNAEILSTTQPSQPVIEDERFTGLSPEDIKILIQENQNLIPALTECRDRLADESSFCQSILRDIQSTGGKGGLCSESLLNFVRALKDRRQRLEDTLEQLQEDWEEREDELEYIWEEMLDDRRRMEFTKSGLLDSVVDTSDDFASGPVNETSIEGLVRRFQEVDNRVKTLRASIASLAEESLKFNEEIERNGMSGALSLTKSLKDELNELERKISQAKSGELVSRRKIELLSEKILISRQQQPPADTNQGQLSTNPSEDSIDDYQLKTIAQQQQVMESSDGRGISPSVEDDQNDIDVQYGNSSDDERINFVKESGKNEGLNGAGSHENGVEDDDMCQESEEDEVNDVNEESEHGESFADEESDEGESEDVDSYSDGEDTDKDGSIGSEDDLIEDDESEDDFVEIAPEDDVTAEIFEEVENNRLLKSEEPFANEKQSESDVKGHYGLIDIDDDDDQEKKSHSRGNHAMENVDGTSKAQGKTMSSKPSEIIAAGTSTAIVLRQPDAQKGSLSHQIWDLLRRIVGLGGRSSAVPRSSSYYDDSRHIMIV